MILTGMDKKYTIGIAFLIFLTAIGVVTLGGVHRNPKKIIMVSKSADKEFEFWQTVKLGAEMAAKEDDVVFEFRGPHEEQDIDNQKQIIKDIIMEKPDIMIVAASNEKELVDLCDEAANVGIKVFTMDSNIDSDSPISFVATDNKAAGAVLADHMVNLIDSQGEIVIINLVAGVSTGKEREEGLLGVFGRYPQIKTHPTKYTNGTNQHAYEITRELLLYQYPDTKAIVGCNQKTVEGVIRAVEELGLQDKIKVGGLDSSLEIIHSLEKDILDVIVIQKPFNMGYISVKNAIKAYKGVKVAKNIDTGHKLITKSTLYLPENQKLLYPIIK